MGGTDATGTLTLTNVTARFQDGEAIETLDNFTFNTVVSGGFAIGDTLDGTQSNTIVVSAVEYNGTSGTIWGPTTGTAFGNGEPLDLNATLVAITTSVEDVGATFTGALVNEAVDGTIAPKVISSVISYDTGTKAIPRFCQIQNAATSPTATAQVEQIFGAVTTGSLRLVDVTGTWADDDPVFIADNIPYDNLQGGQKFRVGDIVVGGTSGATGKIINLEILTGTTGIVILLNRTGTWQDSEQMEVSGVFIADSNDVSVEFTAQHAIVNYGSTALVEIRNQLVSQGGIYGQDVSLNGIRDANALYTFLQDTFDELGALDDEVPMSAQVKLQQYTLINSWLIPDFSFRFLESGSIQDAALANIWTDFQTLGTLSGITDLAFLPQLVQPPQIYIEQDGVVIAPWWLGGQIDVLVKVQTNTLPTLDNADGQLVNAGTVTIFAREFGNTYDHFETTTIAGVAPIPLATAVDINNATGTHIIDIDLLTNLVVGEEIVDDIDETKRGVITALVDASPDTMAYRLTGTTQFASGDTFTGQQSNQARTTSSSPSTLVAGLGSQTIIATIHGRINRGAITAGPLVEGEIITQTTSNAAAVMMFDDDGATQIHFGNWNGTAWDTTNDVIGAASAATFTPSSTTITALTTIVRDIGDGNGDQPYNAVIYMNTDGAGEGETLANMYEWIKYNTRSLEQAGEPSYNLLGGKGANDTDGLQGRIYITLDSSYPLVKVSPFGSFAGGTFFGAQGVFIQNMANADIRNFQLNDANGVLRFPPNLQTLTVQGLISGDRVAVFRRTNSTPGSPINTTEYTIDTVATTVNGTGDTLIRVTSSITTDTPASGVVRVREASTGLFLSFSFNSFTGQEFTLGSGLGADLTATEPAFVPLIEEESSGATVSENIIYLADIPLLARVRKKGILPFEVEGTFIVSGATVTAIRTTDTIVD